MKKLDLNRLCNTSSLSKNAIKHSNIIELMFKDMKNKTEASFDGKISKLCFQEYFDIPLILIERLYNILFSKLDYLNKQEFETGFKKLFNKDIIQLIFDIYDFDNDGKINWNDIRIILNNVLQYTEQFNINKLLEIEYSNKEFINNNSLKDLCLNKQINFNNYKDFIITNDSDSFLIVFYYLNKINFTYDYSLRAQSVDSSILLSIENNIFVRIKDKSLYKLQFKSEQKSSRDKLKQLEVNSNLSVVKTQSSPINQNDFFINKEKLNNALNINENRIKITFNSKDKIIKLSNNNKIILNSPKTPTTKQVLSSNIKQSRNIKVIQPTQKSSFQNTLLNTQISNSNDIFLNTRNVSNSPDFKINEYKNTKNLTRYYVKGNSKSPVKVLKNSSSTSKVGIKRIVLKNTSKKALFNSNNYNKILSTEKSNSQLTTESISNKKDNDLKQLIENANQNKRYHNIKKRSNKNISRLNTEVEEKNNENELNNDINKISKDCSVMNLSNLSNSNFNHESKNEPIVKDSKLFTLCNKTSNIYEYQASLYKFYISLFDKHNSEISIINLVNVFLKEEGDISINNESYVCFSLYHNYNNQYYLYLKTNQIDWITEIKSILPSSKNSIFSYTNEAFLGQGKFSTVHRISKNKKQYAMKIIKKTQMDKMDLISTRKEITILNNLSHENIIKIIDYVETYKHIYIILEYFESSNLFEYFKKKNYELNELFVRYIIKQLVLIIDYLSINNIVHRDLKPENILIKSIGQKIEVKLIDFGLARYLGNNELIYNEPYGTLTYAAPEIILNNDYDSSVDMYSIGIISFFLLSRSLPFMGKSENEIATKIIKNDYTFNSSRWNSVSKTSVDFCKSKFYLFNKIRINM